MQTYLIEQELPIHKEFCAIQYANMGKAYLDATRILLLNINEINGYRFAPLYFLVSHSIECLLKSFLIKHDAFDKFKHEHDLTILIDEAGKRGLLIESSNRYDIEVLNNYIVQKHARHQFRYPVMGTKYLPPVDEWVNVADNIQALIST